MKKFLTRGLILSLLLVVLASFVLNGCTDTTTPTIIENVDRIVFEISADKANVFYSNSNFEQETIYSGTFSESNLGDLIERLNSSNVILSKSTTNTYGSYYTQIGNLVPTGSGYLYFYTNLAAYEEIASDWATTVNFGDKVLKGASVGAASLPLEDKAMYIILLISGN